MPARNDDAVEWALRIAGRLATEFGADAGLVAAGYRARAEIVGDQAQETSWRMVLMAIDAMTEVAQAAKGSARG